jgi:hypothetical protein
MSTENLDTPQEQNPQGDAGQSPDAGQAQSQKMFTEEEVAKLLEERLKNKDMENRRKNEKIIKRLEELEAKEKAGTATPDERIELSQGKTAQAQAKGEGIHPDAIPYIIDEEMAKEKFKQNISNAMEKDPEFKALLTPESKRLVNEDQLFFLRDLPNSAAVLKTLLANKKENNLMQAKFQEMIYSGKPSIMVEYINNLSDKLEQSATKPRASSYTPDPNISDFGDSGQDFDLKKYIAGKP